MANLKDDDIKGLLVREIRSAKQSDDTELAQERTRALEYFNGEMKDTPSEAGRSSVVSRDLADTVGWMLPSLLRVFTASDRMAIAEPVGEEDDDQADNATDGLNYVFMKDNPGYRILRDATWDALVLKNGIIKIWWDDTPEYATSFHSGLNDDQLAMLEADDSVEITHQTTTVEKEWIADPATGQEIEVPINTHEVKLKRLKSKGRTRIDCIPPEDYLQDAQAVTTEEARFKAHRSEKTRSDLIEMGFDRDEVMDLGTTKTDEASQLARDDYSDEDAAASKAMELVELYECYLKVDVDDDGIAETIRAYYAGNKDGGTLLDWEVWEDEGPFYDIPCDPIPHRWAGKSIADETMDMQRLKTVLLRQGLDNTYASNNPMRFVQGKVTNPDALFSPSFGEVIFGDANTNIIPLPIPFVANHAYEAMAYADEVIQRRTGVGRQSMALDPEALQNQTATANQNNKDAAYSQVELIARDMAELGWKPVFRALLKLEIRHQDRARTVRMGKKVVNIDPRSWNADMDITINVGLGTGSRDRDLMMLNSVLANQIMLTDRLAAGGFPDKALDMLPFIHNTLIKTAESAGLRNPDAFYPDVDKDDIEAGKQRIAEMANKPDPKVAEAQAREQTKQQQAQADHEYRMAMLSADTEAKRQKAEFEHQQTLYRIEQDRQAKEFQIAQELQLKRDQLSGELNLQRELGFAKLDLQQELGASVPVSGATTSGVTMGGEPG